MALTVLIGSQTTMGVGNTTITLTPVNAQVYWSVQNVDTVPLTVVISGSGDQNNAGWTLNPGVTAGYAGGFVDNYQMGCEGGETIILTSTKTNHTFNSLGSRIPYIQIARNG